jgi:hypothetical protein
MVGLGHMCSSVSTRLVMKSFRKTEEHFGSGWWTGVVWINVVHDQWVLRFGWSWWRVFEPADIA